MHPNEVDLLAAVRVRHRQVALALFALALGLAMGMRPAASGRRPEGANGAPSAPPGVKAARWEQEPGSGEGTASLGQVIERATRYVVQYGDRLTLLIGVEHYTQWVANADVTTMGTSAAQRPWSRETIAEFALVRVGTGWQGYRDVYEVDGKKVGDRENRLAELFLRRPEEALVRSRLIADESARYNAGAVNRNFNTPTMALLFLQPSSVQRFRVRKRGTETIDGVVCWKVAYDEQRRPTIIRTSAGDDVPVRGSFWIEPASGAVVRTYMDVTGEAPLAGGSWTMQDGIRVRTTMPGEFADRRVETYSRTTTKYARDPKLDILVPAEMEEVHQGVSLNAATGEERVTKVTCVARYSGFKRFETSGQLVVPR